MIKIYQILVINRLYCMIMIYFRKSLLIEASSLGDFTSDKYIEIQRRIDASFQNVNPADEYREFTDKHK